MLAQSTRHALEAAGHDVLALGSEDADVTRYDALLHPIQTFKPDWVFHLAAFTRVDDCESRPDHAYQVNAAGARNAALAAAACGAAILAVSTDYVFSGKAQSPYREYDPPDPQSVYGKSKWAGEQAVREVNPRHLVVRTAWLYGRGGRNFIDTILEKAGSGEPLWVVNDQRGSPTWTHDLGLALVHLAGMGHFGTLHCTNSGHCTWFDLAVHAIRLAGLDTKVEPTDSGSLDRPAKRPAYSVLDSRWYELVSGKSMPTWEDAVDRYLKTRSMSGRVHAG
jgi:dTDP-4-dehydrorhamnose reductase